jgi:hypothetical protein
MPRRVRLKLSGDWRMFKKVGLVDLARGGPCEGGVEAVEVLDEDGNGHSVHEKPSSVAQT